MHNKIINQVSLVALLIGSAGLAVGSNAVV
jgi:hypothetical protein